MLAHSGSMEPAFYRGDILFLHMGFTPFRAGDIVVFKVADREIPIVHRIIKVWPMHGGVCTGCSPRQPEPWAPHRPHPPAPRRVRCTRRRAARWTY